MDALDVLQGRTVPTENQSLSNLLHTLMKSYSSAMFACVQPQKWLFMLRRTGWKRVEGIIAFAAHQLSPSNVYVPECCLLHPQAVDIALLQE